MSFFRGIKTNFNKKPKDLKQREMAYLPFRMYGNNRFRLPIIDIVQTIDCAGKTGKPTRPITTWCSNNRLKFLKREFKGKEKSKKGALIRSEEESGQGKVVEVGVKAGAGAEAGAGAGSVRGLCVCYCDRERNGERLGDPKSVEVLFKANKNGTWFQRNETDEEETFSLAALRSSAISTSDLKRKKSFVDYVKMKRRKKVGF